MTLEELVNKNYDNLNENDLHIWLYIVQNNTECEKLSIEALASRCNVSRTTILRFCKRLGLKGYSELKVRLSMNNEHKIRKTENSISIKQLYLKYMEQLEANNFYELIEIIENANHLFIYGEGTLQKNIAREWERGFLAVNKLFYGITSQGDMHYVDNMHSGDLLVVISFSGDTISTLNFAKKLKIKGVKIVAITLNKQNELAKLSDIAYGIDSLDLTTNLGTHYTCVAGYFIFIDFLINAFIEKSMKEGVVKC
ncbi:hypothetical protein AN639_07240 [Candidatus Epulonipiscium fishelsonii]|uniref:Uncharacterized protein n=1 Tax=Candidatus Epulonipiscium fishelsonii TaxID=77094 RepID=A0ACC8X9Y4_9FIRM|nr:hypothetical protein AN639_07240 [Epulopiscium sp. SCG-B05WGA-EpuloA1]ONI39043.1 hypothetical protein AN396_09220 [Epulopiscium sp. SCG-B11WGA-EpuloA1]